MISDVDFTVIVKETKRVVLGAIRAHLPERFSGSIDDIVQETYVRAFRALSNGKFRGDSKMESWLYAIARNETMRMSAKLMRYEKKIEKAAKGEAEKNTVLTNSGEDEITHLKGLIELMTPLHRDVFTLLVNGKNEGEIALQLGIPRGTVKSRISRGRTELKRIRKEAEDGE